MKTTQSKLRTCLKALARGDVYIIELVDGTLVPTDCQDECEIEKVEGIRTIESRIQYLVYGEWPLSPENQDDWDYRVSKAFAADFYRTA